MKLHEAFIGPWLIVFQLCEFKVFKHFQYTLIFIYSYIYLQ